MADIQIFKPGRYSRLVSPIDLEFSLIPISNGFARVELLGEDGRLIVRHLIRYGKTSGQRLPVGSNVEFAIPGAAEVGRLQVLVEDAEQRVVSVSSVDVILLSMGENERNPVSDTLEPLFIQRPWPQALVQGGIMHINGYLRPMNPVQPVIFEIFTLTGELVGSKQLTPQEVVNGAHYPFQLDIQYTVSKGVWARLVVRQSSDRIPGDVALNSFQIYLKP